MALTVLPRLGESLPGVDNNIAACPRRQVADDRGFEIDGFSHILNCTLQDDAQPPAGAGFHASCRAGGVVGQSIDGYGER